ncbi:MAG: group 1 glycosyl transferase [Candidatus Gottesmanbacteria bacterium GW2011_GWA2_43_14]|uniref:Group 1 glycosyl transferase n=1 Tax=Candidatus Gottesmanbacteria bacterium GW2011_GWA2_43_14 TaxID=1618443 RepID=A0A0G1DLB1_9BACT|nr:MAG: group 1 glycosyl transferase [Candidatus Gottesmanbacteria bacterium GW2011_GWA2_43_14]
MNILLIHNFYKYPGGEDMYVLSLQKLLLNKGHNVYLLRRDNRDIGKKISYSSAAKSMFGKDNVYRELIHIIHKFKPDVVHVNNVYPLISEVIYSILNKYKIPTVRTFHNYRSLCAKSILFRNGKICELCPRKNLQWPSIIHSCYQNSLIASSMLMASRQYFRLKKKIQVKANIFLSKFSFYYHQTFLNNELAQSVNYVFPTFVNRLESKKIIPSNYFFYAGRLSEEKGILDLLSIFSSTDMKQKLFVAGDGPLKQKISFFKKFKNISLLGNIPNAIVNQYMQKAICIIIPSKWYEVLPLTLLESFSNSTPVIVPNLGSFEDIVKDGKTGFFYDNESTNSLKSLINTVNKYPNKLKAMKKECKIEFEKKYSAEIHYSNLIKVYSEVLN